MFFLKCVIYVLIFSSSTYIGILISKRYKNRVTELNEFKIALNILKTKIRFTNETLEEIFYAISINLSGNISILFSSIASKLKNNSACYAWESSIDESFLHFNKEDREALKTLGKLLGKTDLDGQLSEIELTKSFLETQICEAQKQREKNEKLYKTLGMITGVGIVIILM